MSCSVDINIANELKQELNSILNYWRTNTIDGENGGFVARRDFFNKLDPFAAKGAILNARILWTFSAAYRLYKNRVDLLMAERAYGYIVEHFVDKEYEGIFWSVDPHGIMVDGKKQVYAQAFVIYALAEYYHAVKKEEALNLAHKIYDKIEKYSLDKVYNGYLEAFTRDWKPIEDMRLSTKDRNDSKTMNTHLHVLEAYTNLYRVTNRKSDVGHSLKNMINVYIDKFIDEKGHLKLFFDEQWNHTDSEHSYGHEIESAWLLVEAAEALGDEETLEKAKNACKALAAASLEGVQADGSMINHRDTVTGKADTDRHFWIQAEAMVGYAEAYELTKDESYKDAIAAQWKFIQDYQKDKLNGEWHLIIQENYTPKEGEDKVGFWKCPYHNSRACMELLTRFEQHRI